MTWRRVMGEAGLEFAVFWLANHRVVTDKLVTPAVEPALGRWSMAGAMRFRVGRSGAIATEHRGLCIGMITTAAMFVGAYTGYGRRSFGSVSQGFGIVTGIVLYIGIDVPMSFTTSSGFEGTRAVTTKGPVRILQIL
jgi:hypothetical protein